MKRNNKFLIVGLVILFSLLIAGFGFTTKLGYPINGICFYLGIAGMFI